jgi:hypothetical protein
MCWKAQIHPVSKENFANSEKFTFGGLDGTLVAP